MDHIPPLLPVLAVATLSPWLSSHTRSLRVPVASVNACLKRWDRAEEYANRTLELDEDYVMAKRLLKEISEARQLSK